MTQPATNEEVLIECDYLQPHEHVFSGNWVFGGADGVSWNADPRWVPLVHTFYDANMMVVFQTSAYLCTEEALDSFTTLTKNGLEPRYVTEKKEGDAQGKFLPWEYTASDDSIHPMRRL